MKIKTGELIGLSLDRAVAVCEGHNVASIPFGGGPAEFSYSTNWIQGGPIIEREKIDIMWEPNGKPVVRGSTWINGVFIASYGPTPLIAAMRCYVASKMGDEIEIPEELVK